MELFASPQTMVNANINNEEGAFSGASGTVLDPFLPLMTLEKLSIRVAGLGSALHSNKTGNLSFVLHDRSRMADIAPLLAVDAFSQTHLVIEWGWNHPDGMVATGNAYGSLLNSMKSVGAFNIVASNFTIGNDGQVRVDMQLASRGSSEIQVFPIATGALMPITPFKSMLTSYLAKKLEKINAEAAGTGSSEAEKTKLAEIRSSLTLTMNNASSPSTVIGRDKFLKFLNILNPPPDTEIVPTELTELLAELVGDPGKSAGLISTSNQSLTAEVSKKTSDMMLTLDPFYPAVINKHIGESMKKGTEKDYISLGKILMTFVGAPLAGSSRFDEVQMMFYRFNLNSGSASKLDSVASFLVSKTDFDITMQDLAVENPSLSIQGFINTINQLIISVPSDVNYGLTSLSNELSALDKKSAEENKNPTEVVKTDLQQQTQELNDKVEARLKAIYMDGPPVEPTFRLPKLSMLFEAVPAFVPSDPPDEKPQFEIDNSKVILRVHLFDQNASPHTNEMFLINCMNDSDLAIHFKTASDTTTAEAVTGEGNTKGGGESGEVDTQTEAGNLNALEGDDYLVYTSNIPNTEIKRVIKNTVPSLTYGMGWSALTNFSMRSTTGGAVGTAMLVSAVKNKPSKPGESKGATNSLEDITVIPANATMSLLGCPLFEYGQQFFIDLGTGTTADNMYRVIGIEHSLSQGEFTTNITLGFNGTGTMKVFRSIIAAAMPALEADVTEEESET